MVVAHDSFPERIAPPRFNLLRAKLRTCLRELSFLNNSSLESEAADHQDRNQPHPAPLGVRGGEAEGVGGLAATAYDSRSIHSIQADVGDLRQSQQVACSVDNRLNPTSEAGQVLNYLSMLPSQ
jgi:hypothetical protein